MLPLLGKLMTLTCQTMTFTTSGRIGDTLDTLSLRALALIQMHVDTMVYWIMGWIIGTHKQKRNQI